ncbi:hypothetical protein [Pseudogemmobacter faecipullorum]|uniref:Uncharacterized protein n=1 Tax=Pseudogemmobacter faecipullorum TaxID=2755041 RepID=A0ABS8CJ71_9RHOB|nr:hypothetical protein [Pseudogemmobacter faecipullorum]MCB5409447.1 hypothetical protein [Pseudogemmobacter faecipullorum]
MSLENDNPGAAATATGAEIDLALTPEYRLRREWATSAWFALDHCDRQDVLHICATYLADLETGGPVMGDLLGTLTGDALFWADCAPAHELVAYGTAALDRLRRIPLGINTRKRLFADLWKAFAPDHRQAFLASIEKSGKGSA